MGSEPDINDISSNSCSTARAECLNCHGQFLAIRPLLTGIVVTRQFSKDFRSPQEAEANVAAIMECSNVDFYEMHKLEANIDGNLIFRAKREGVHMVYAVDKQLRVVFLRAFRNYSEYGKFLEDKQEIKKMIIYDSS